MNYQIKRKKIDLENSFDKSPQKSPSKTMDIEINREKYDILRETFNSNNSSNNYLGSGASKNFDNKINNIDHAFINSKNENFVNQSILFRTPEEIQKSIIDNLQENYDYLLLEKEILEDEEKLKNLSSDPESLKSNQDANGINRGICNLCRLECKGYQPDIHTNYESSDKYPGLCITCGCGASNHIPSEEKLSFFPKEILNLTVNSVLIESNINFNSILVLFEIVNLKKNNISNLIQLLKDAGFIINANNLQKMDQDSELYKLKSNINNFYKSNEENLNESHDDHKRNNNLSDKTYTLNKFDIVKYFLKDNLNEEKQNIQKIRDNTMDKTLKKINQINSMTNNSKNLNPNYKTGEVENLISSQRGVGSANFSEFNKKLGTNSLYNSEDENYDNNSKDFKNRKKLKSLVEFENNFFNKFKNEILSLSLTINNQEDIRDFFEKFVLSCKKMFPDNINLIYYSKNKINALWDIQVLFPNLFKINSFISFLAEKPDFFEENLSNNSNKNKTLEQYNNLLKTSNKFFALKDKIDLNNNSLNFSKINQTNFNKNEVNIDKFSSYENLNMYNTTGKILPDKNLIIKILSKKNTKENNDEKTNNKININLQKYNSSNYFENSSNNFKKIPEKIHNYKKLFSRFLDFQISKYININKKIIHYEKIFDLIAKLGDFQDFNFIKNISNYISKNNYDDNLSCSLIFQSYIGNSNFIKTISDNNLEIINFNSTRDIELISNIFFKETIEYEHITIIMRPYIVRSGISEIILNIFKLNNFQILKRKLKVLDKDEAKLLFKYEKLDGNFEEYYFKMMTDSNSEIVLLAKFGAINDAKIICNGNNLQNSNKNNSSIIDLLNLNYELEIKNDWHGKIDPKKKFKEKFKSIPSYDNESNLFYNFNNLINFDFIIKKIIDKVITKYNTNVNNSERYSNLLELRKKFENFSHTFNICMFIPQELENPNKQINFNYVNTFEIEKHFFPEFSDVQEVIIIIKPDPTEKNELNDYIKICLNRMSFEILETKKIKLNELEINNIFDKYFHFTTPYEYSTNKDIFLNYECEILRLVKSGCMLELQNIIGKENYEFFQIQNNFNIFEEKLKILKNNCYLLYSSQESEYFYSKVSDKIFNIEGNYLINFPENIFFILNSCLKTTVAENIREDPAINETLINRYIKFFHQGNTEDYNSGLNKIISLYMFAKEDKNFFSFPQNFEIFFTLLNLNNDFYNSNITFFAETENSGFYEIRIPYLQSHLLNSTNISNENMIDLDINRIQLSKYYHYLEEGFYKQIEEKFNNNDIIIDLEQFDYLLKPDNQINILVNSSSLNSRLFKKTKYEINKIFYKFCSENYLNLTPDTYHYRIKPEDIEMDINRIYEVEDFQGLLFLDIVSQDYLGYSDKVKYKDFSYKNLNENSLNLNKSMSSTTMNNTINDFEKYSDKKLKLAFYYEKMLEFFQSNNQIENTSNLSDQYSLSSFLWGRKLAKLCKKFEALINPENNNNENLNKKETQNKFFKFNLKLFKNKPDDIINCGPLFFSLEENKIKGIVVERYLTEYDQYLYVNILHDLKSFQEMNLFETEIFKDRDYQIVENKLFDILSSTAFKESRNSENLTIVPARLKENNLRINRKIFNKNKNSEKEKFKENKMDPMKFSKLHEFFKTSILDLTNQNSGKYICFSDLYCIKSTVYRYYGSIMFILKIFYKKLVRKTNLLGNLSGIKSEEEYDKMLDAIIVGFNNFMDLDSKNDENGYNCYKNEYYLYLISEIKYNLNELSNLQKILKEMEGKSLINDYIYNRSGNKEQFKGSNSEKNKEILIIENFIVKIKKEISDLNMNIEIIFYELKNYEIKHRIMKTEDNNKLISLNKENYHIPMHNDEKWEKDIYNERYIQKKVLNRSFLMTKEVLNNLKNKNFNYTNFIKNKIKTNYQSGNNFPIFNTMGNIPNLNDNNSNQYIFRKILLRKPEEEISNEILIEKDKKDSSKKHPIKNLAENLRKKIDDNY